MIKPKKNKKITKPQSFPNEKVIKISLTVPLSLVRQMKYEATDRDLRFNQVAATAFQRFLRSSKRSRQ